MAIHSKFLVHWTGKGSAGTDIESEPDIKVRRTLYVERLRDDYERGLFAKKTDEDAIRQLKMKRLVRLCFTEIRLSQTATHAERFGKLGIGFERDFVMNKGGRPVIYVPYEADDKLMEENMKFLFDNSTGEVHRRLKWLFSFVKRMSDGAKKEFYEELEWRVVYGESLDKGHFTKMADGTYRWKFEPSDVQLIVFPDKKTKDLALADPVLQGFFGTHSPIMLTLEDCENF